MKKLITVLALVLLLCSCADSATNINLDRLNWTQSLPVGANITIDEGYLVDAKLGYSFPQVTVGPYKWCDYVTDGTSDETEVNTALATGMPVLIVGQIECDDQITIPTSGDPVLMGLDATILCEHDVDGELVISSTGQVTNAIISGLKINGNGKYIHGIFLYSGAVNCRIENNEIYGIVQNNPDTVYPIWLHGTATVLNKDNTISSNYIHDNIAGNQIFVSNSHKFTNRITGNKIYHGKPYGTQQYSGIYGDNCIITENRVIGYGLKTQSYDTCTGTGICGGENSVISNNVIIGVSKSGIVPGYKNVVTGNKIIAPGCNGIDAWYSSDSIISDNSILYPGNMDESVSWDQCGIDLCDHSQDIQVANNNINGHAVVINYILASQANSGNNYIVVNSPGEYYEGLRIKIGTSDKYRIDYIDPISNRIYLTTTLTQTYASGTYVSGVNCMTLGINVGDNGQSLGFHIVEDNFIFGPTLAPYLAPGASMLPHTYVDDFVYTSDPGFLRKSHALYTLYTGGNYYMAEYVYDVGTKKVQIS